MTKTKNNKIFIFIMFIVATSFIYNIMTSFDNDFFHIASSGRWIVENKTIMHENVFFVLNGYKTVIQQWLYSILLYGSYAIGGFLGVKIFTLIQFVLLSVLIFKLLRDFNIDWRNSIFIITASMYVMNYINCRPQMISLMLIYIQFIILEKFKTSNNKKFLYFLPLLTLFEINLHCTFWIFHFIFLLPYIIPLKKYFKVLKIHDSIIDFKLLIMPVLLMIASLFINPYGINGIMCLFYSSDISAIGIDELNYVNFISIEAFYLIIGIALLFFLYKKGSLTSTTFYITLGTGIFYMMAVRNSILFSVAIVYLLKDLFKSISSETVEIFYQFLNCSNKKERKILFLFLVIIGLLFLFCFKIQTKNNASDCNFTPIKAVKYIRENEKDISSVKTFTDFNAGAYFTWNNIGKIYFEPKTEPYIKEINGVKDIISEYVFLQKYACKSDIDNFLNEYDFDYLYVPYNFPALQTYLDLSKKYKCVVIGSEKKRFGYPLAEYRLYKKIQ